MTELVRVHLDNSIFNVVSSFKQWQDKLFTFTQITYLLKTLSY